MHSETSKVHSFRFLSADLERHEGMAVWREVVGRTILKLDPVLLPDCPFYSESRTWTALGLRLTWANKSGLCMERSRQFLADGNDDISLHIGDSGVWIISQRGQEVVLGKSEGVLMSNAEVGAVKCLHPARLCCIQIPRRMLAPLVPNLEDALMCPIPKNNEALKLLIGYVQTLKTRVPVMQPGLQHMIVHHIRDVLAAVLNGNDKAGAPAESAHAARLAAVKHDINRNLGSIDALSLGAIARRHRVLPRYVQRLFERDGISFTEYVREQRLERAYRMLSEPEYAGHTIGAIARANGFAGAAQFNRAFRRRFGTTPSDIRAQAQRQ